MFKKLLILAVIGTGILFFANRAISNPAAAPVKAEAASEAAPLQMAPGLPAAVTPAEDAGAVPENEQVKEDPQGKDATPVDEKADDLYAQVELFSYALTTIQSEYVEQKKARDIIYGALTGMLGSLDPHSQFLTPEDFKDLKTETEGKFGGLGIEISVRDSLLTVVTPIEDTPAWKVGIKAGDRIVKIEKELTRDMTLNDAVKKLRGEPGSKVHITVFREAESKIREFDIVREIIHIQDIKDPHLLDDKIAYLRLAEFREDSAEQMAKALRKLKEEGANALILDVRNNPGGLLNVAIKISEMFLPEGKTIVSTKGRHPSQNSVSVSHNKADEFSDWPIALLFNEGSASGSEILAGALKDNRRAVTIGTKSFGKGSVQSVIPLPDGSGLRLTTSKYFTPSGECIHEKGIIPDIVIERAKPATDPEEDEVTTEKKKAGDPKKVFDDIELQDGKDLNEIAKLKKQADLKQREASDNQLQSAISVIKGIRVYKKLQSGNNES